MKLQSKRNGQIAEVKEVKNGVYVLGLDGKEIKVKENTIKRWWKKVEEKKEEKKETKREEKKETKKKEVKNQIEKENKKEVKSSIKETKKKENPSKKTYIKVKTTFPLRTYWNWVIHNCSWDLKQALPKLNKQQKQELIKYFLENDKDGKHSNFLRKQNLIK